MFKKLFDNKNTERTPKPIGLNEMRELCRIANLNVISIRSSINNINANFHAIKGRTGVETKSRKALMLRNINWLTHKLEEEIYWANYYELKLKSL